MNWAAVSVTLRVGDAARPDAPAPHGDIPRGALPFTGAAIVTLVAAAVVMLVLGTVFLLHAREEER